MQEILSQSLDQNFGVRGGSESVTTSPILCNLNLDHSIKMSMT